ncbi:MAG: potassium-transporting ATPase subunit C [Pirellulales bacterium]
MFKEAISSLKLAIVTIAVCAVAYPVAILAFAAVAAPEARLGSLVLDAVGNVIGSRLIAQEFTKPEYFWPRPSACNYNAMAACGSNLSPANPALRERADTILHQFGLDEDTPLPADLVTASGGGLDPHISFAAAKVQTTRIAKARGISEGRINEVIEQHAEQIPLTSDATARIVNVLDLNMALDAATASATP